MGEHYNADFHRWVTSSDVECKETDFAARVARVNESQIIDFISTGFVGKDGLPWLALPLKTLNFCAQRLLIDGFLAHGVAEFLERSE